MGYGERHFEGPPGQKGANSKQGTWARVLLVCGQFERVCHCNGTFRLRLTSRYLQAVAALYEKPELQVEAVHLSITLAYHGLLRVTSKVEATDAAICMSPRLSLIRADDSSSNYPV